MTKMAFLRSTLPIVLSMVLPSCAPSVLELSTPMASAARLSLVGFGASPAGQFSVGDNRGTFRRFAANAEIESPVEIPLTRYVAGGTFTVSGSDFVPAVQADCLSTEGRWVTASADTTVEPFRYECRLTSEGQAIGDLMITQSTRKGGSDLSTPTRRGFIRLDGRMYDLRPVHRLAGTSVETVEPAGFELVLDGNVVGAFPTYGVRKELVALASGRRAVIASAICLSLWID